MSIKQEDLVELAIFFAGLFAFFWFVLALLPGH